MARWSTARWIGSAVGVAVLGVAIFVVYAVVRYAYVTVPNAYAAENTGWIVGEYVKTHNWIWPKSWADLRGGTYTIRSLGPDAMDDLEARVEIDWNADPYKIARAPEPVDEKPSFQVIWLKNGRHTFWSGGEPNTIIWNTLNWPDFPPSTKPATKPAAK